MPTELYKIGTVAKVTGISVECLRAWERRYGMDLAERAGRTRFYNSNDIEWLKRIKLLLDQGHPISQVIHLDNQELDARLNNNVHRIPERSQSRLKIALVGGGLLSLETEQKDPNSMDVRSRHSNLETLENNIDSIGALDVIVIELPSLDFQLIDYYKEFITCPIVVVYRYALQSELDLASKTSLPVLPWPATWETIERTCAAEKEQSAGEVHLEKKFTDEQLVDIATKAPISDSGLSPKSIVQLIRELDALAIHADRYANSGKADIRMTDLYRNTSLETQNARSKLESVLEQLNRQYNWT